MRRYLLALAALAALSQGAEAVCSKSSLKGTWATNFTGTGVIGVNNSNVMAIFFPIGSFSTLKIVSFGSNCKGSGTVTTFTGATLTLPASITGEMVNSSSSVKPDLLTVRVAVGPVEYVVNLTRIQ